MPRARKLNKFFIHAPKKYGRHKGQRLLGIETADEVSVQDLIDFLKEKGISPSSVPLSSGFMAYAKPEDKYPPISPGTVVETTTKPNLALREEWTDKGWAVKKWGVRGTIVTHHDSHGLCYDVTHDDGTRGCYAPSELKVV